MILGIVNLKLRPITPLVIFHLHLVSLSVTLYSMARKLLPAKVTIFGLDIEVEEVVGLYSPDGIKVDGLYSGTPLKVLIEHKLSKDEKYVAFLHEIGHALFSRLFSCAGIPDEIEEVIVDNFSVMVNEVFNLSIKRDKSSGNN